MKIFELIMLICFGLAWPFNLHKSWRVRTALGKSVLFLCAVFTGYVSGMVYKYQTGWDWVSWVYLVNALMVAADIALYVRNRKIDRDTREVSSW